MISTKYKAKLELEALELGKQRRMDFASEQALEIAKRDNPTFLKVTRRITDSEKRLISFITKTLTADVLLDGGIVDAFVL